MGRMILTLPRLGETMEEAKVVEWLVAPGSPFKRGAVLLEVETDKTVVEVPALADGVLLDQLVGPGDVVALDQPIAEVEGEGPSPAAKPETTPEARIAAPVISLDHGPRPAASPAARAAARRAGVDLTGVQGTGRRGRIMAADVASPQEATTVLLHGLFDDHTGWRDLTRRLQAAGHAVLALDLPGHGQSPPAETLDAALTHIEAVLPAGPLRLIGHSLGAALAVLLATRLNRVQQLILCAPAGLDAHLNPDFTDGVLCAETPAALARALVLLGGGPVSTTVLEAELTRLKSLRPGHRALANALVQQGFQQIDITGDISRLTCAVTVLFGTEDRILNWQAVANLPAATAIHLIKGAGHLPHHAAPDLVVRLATTQAERRIATA